MNEFYTHEDTGIILPMPKKYATIVWAQSKKKASIYAQMTLQWEYDKPEIIIKLNDDFYLCIANKEVYAKVKDLNKQFFLMRFSND